MQGPLSSDRCSNEVVATKLTRKLRSKQRRGSRIWVLAQFSGGSPKSLGRHALLALLVWPLPSPLAALARHIVEAQAATVSWACISDLVKKELEEVPCSKRVQITLMDQEFRTHPALVSTCICRPHCPYGAQEHRRASALGRNSVTIAPRSSRDFDLGHVIWRARGREVGREGVLSSLRDLHSSMVIFLPLRRAIGKSNLGRFHVSGRSYLQVALGLRMQLCTQIAVQGFKTVADGRTSIYQCRSSGRWINRGGCTSLAST